MKRTHTSRWLAGIARLLIACMLVALLAASYAPPAAAAAQRTITVQALVDGRSRLILDGNTAQWQHFDYAAPGRHMGENQPTVINGIDWYPTWPDVPDAENRDCSCYSSVFRGIKPALPNARMSLQLDIVEARGEVSIIEQPNEGKRGRVIIEFDDNPQGGPEIYKISLTFSFGGPK